MKELFVCFLILPLCGGATRLPSEGTGATRVTVGCHNDQMRVSISTHDDFNGMVYPRGLSENSSCLAEYHHGGSRIEYRLPLHSCNTMSSEGGDGVEYFNTIVVQPHPKLVTGLGRGFQVRCKYQTDRRSLDWMQNVGSVGTTPVAASAPLPVCSMKIFRDDRPGSVADHAKIGDRLTLVVAIDPQETYGMKVTNCVVRDGLNWAEQPLVNNDGCPVDEEVMGSFRYDADDTRATVTFPAHKFPYAPSVYYQCNVKLCRKKEGGCPELPPRCDGQDRGKRSADPPRPIRELEDPKYLNVEVYSGLYVDEADQAPGETGGREEARPTDRSDDFCVSTRKFAVGIAVAGVLLTLAVLLLIACILHRRRRRKGTSTAGSSIYSGPYSNRAYSRD